MAESISSSVSVSRQILADMRTAFHSYAKNSDNSVKAEEETYTNNGQITRKALSDINNSIEIKAKEAEAQEETATTQDQQGNVSNQINNTQTQENTNVNQVEVKQFTLPKNTQTIIAELKRNGLNRTLSAYDIADKYSITYMKAREILDELNKDSNGYIREYKLPENSTISYKV